ncbi:RNA polymerase sigma factor [Mucilaginibacter sp. UR6-11]|uniref:RNA polymerase sigma factor n=1 Tax=Mucilaginibacter sp. UR6-11 TaxID=1435644 RepID=UPI001E34DE33|nr:RNA polymerase sigma-70 factor [Mucilaginibacter sp. UR6-11]MCC8425948.1 RNA polymerase sigma-70 factor [Mucilaginibacter sp. UR6-11]
MTALSTLSDPELVALLQQGDHAAFTEIYDRYNGLLYVFAYKRLHDREEARDVIHELFLHFWTGHQDLFLTNNLSAYLYTATRNRIINVVTRQKVASRYIDSFQSYLDQSPAAGTDYLVRYNELNEFIEHEIAALPERIRLVFELSRKTNLTRKEIAEKLGVSEETVKSQMHSALKALKTKLGPFFFFVF